MRQAGIVGIHRRKTRGCTCPDATAEAADDLANRRFDPPEPDRLWGADDPAQKADWSRFGVAYVLGTCSLDFRQVDHDGRPLRVA